LEELTFINASDGNLPMKVGVKTKNKTNKEAVTIAQAPSK